MDRNPARLAGGGFEVIEEGMNSRTLNSDDPRPHKEGRNGLTYLKPCLDSHDPLDLVILMLGTNELKDVYDIPSTEIALLVEKYIEIIITPRMQYANQLTKLLLLSPPILNLEVDYARERYTHSRERNLALAEDYRKLAEAHSCLFLNAAEIVTVGADGVHFDAENHKKLGEKIAEIIRENL